MPRPIDREALRAELLRAARLLSDPVTDDELNPASSYAYRLGQLQGWLSGACRELDLYDVGAEFRGMLQSEHERRMGESRERVAALAPLAGDVSEEDETAYFDSLDDAAPVPA